MFCLWFRRNEYFCIYICFEVLRDIVLFFFFLFFFYRLECVWLDFFSGVCAYLSLVGELVR